MADKVYYCENCGNIMEFNVKSQKLKCKSCGTTQMITNDQKSIVEHPYDKRAERKKQTEIIEREEKTMECKGCGALIRVPGDVTSTACPYCGSQYVLSDKQQDAINPDGVVPFKIDKNSGNEIFKSWISKRWLAPSRLKNLYEKGGLQGIYMPYWTFDADTYSRYNGEGGRDRQVKEKDKDGNVVTKTVTDWYPVTGHVEKFFDDVLVRASESLDGKLLKGIEPYNTTKELNSYSPEYMSGYSAELYKIPIEDAHESATEIMESELKNMAEKDVRRTYDKVRNIRLDTRYSDETYKHVLVPIYSMAYNFEGKTYNVLINGETGKIKGEAPVSKVKVIAIILIVIAIIAGIIAAANAKKTKGAQLETEASVEYEVVMEQDYNEVV